MRSRKTNKLVAIALGAATLAGCVAQSTYRRDKERDAEHYNNLAERFTQLESSFNDVQEKNKTLLSQILATKFAVEADLFENNDYAHSQESLRLLRLIHRIESELRTDLKAVSDREAQHYQSNQDGIAALTTSTRVARDQLEARLDTRLQALAKTDYDRHEASRSSIAALTTSTTSARGELETRLGARIDSVGSDADANKTTIDDHYRQLQTLLTQYQANNASLAQANTARDARIAQLQAQVAQLIARPSGARGTPQPAPLPAPATVGALPAMNGKNIYISIVRYSSSGPDFRYFSRHVGYIPQTTANSAFNPTNNHVDLETARDVRNLITRAPAYADANNQADLARLLDRANGSIVELETDELKQLVNSGLVKKLINRNVHSPDQIYWTDILSRVRGSDDYSVFLSFRSPADIR